MTRTDAPVELSAAEQRGSSRRSMIIAAAGTIIEWYDFSLYIYVAPVLTRVFFGGNEHSLILTFGVFAAGFLFRPIGAVVFGHLGDRVGRKNTLVISAGLMAVAMFGVAALPSAESIGVAAGIGLLLFRCLAGFSVGAEYTGILVFLLESAPAHRRGFATSWAAANSEVGALLAVGVATLFSANLSTEALDSWGWRLTFVIGGVLAAVMIPLRNMLEETVVFRRCQESGVIVKSPVREVLRRQPRAVLLAFAISTVGSVSYFLNISYVPTFLDSVVHLAQTSALLLGTLAAAIIIAVTPLIGYVSDRVGRRPTMLVIAFVLVVTTVPFFATLLGGSTTVVLLGTVALAVPAAAWSAVAAAAVPEQFAAVGRFCGMAIGYNVATTLFGGLSPLIATLLLEATGWRLAPAAYATVVALAVLPLLLLMRETAGRPLPDRA
ncbi:MAG TPA: MFS transporter [Pseudonocardia sp.]|nr:MFS transporter [Pseudonocardia sp.]